MTVDVVRSESSADFSPSPALETLNMTYADQENPEDQRPPLPVIEVEWGLTINLGNYNSSRLSARASVPPGRTPEGEFRELQVWIDTLKPVSDLDSRDLAQLRREHDSDMRDLNARMETVHRRWDMCRAFCVANGLEIPGSYKDDLPF